MELARPMLGDSSDRSLFNERRCSVSSQSPRRILKGKEIPWIDIFVQARGNEFYVRVPDSFMMEGFNLLGLENLLPTQEYFNETVEYIMSTHTDSDEDSEPFYLNDMDNDIKTASEVIFEHIHARFLLTHHGMELVKEKFLKVVYGRCPRVCCQGTPVLPVGLSDCWRDYLGVKLYCPSCDDIFHPKKYRFREVNGAGFGRSFPHNFLMHYPRPIMFKDLKIEPRIHGFKIHPVGYSLQHVISKRWEDIYVPTSKTKRLKVTTDGSLCYSTNRNEADDETDWMDHLKTKKKKYSKKKHMRIED
uniref:Casein kinase II subunit beta n=1 Tax=Caligus clemensi TaxID=344056 RepID=C1C219_CALCM|nr:Casein kinase II subunit beta [Caligus clemensi]